MFVENCNCPTDGSPCSISFSLKANRWSVNRDYGPFDQSQSGKIFWFVFSTSHKDKEFVIRDDSLGCDETTEDYRIGIVENVYGIDKNGIPPNYNTLKNKLNYPENKDFILKLNEEVRKSKDPSQGVNIYVKEWDDFYVDENGNRESVKVSITVW